MRSYTAEYRQIYDEAEAARNDDSWYPGKGEPVVRPLKETVAAEAASIARRPHEWLSIIPVTASGEANVAAAWRESIGHAAKVTFDPAAMARRLKASGCRGVVVLHCHPGGDPTPSAADADANGRLQEALHAAGITLIDSLVVGRRGPQQQGYSFKESGQLPAPRATAAAHPYYGQHPLLVDLHAVADELHSIDPTYAARLHQAWDDLESHPKYQALREAIAKCTGIPF
jgi:hypothetical protein